MTADPNPIYTQLLAERPLADLPGERAEPDAAAHGENPGEQTWVPPSTTT